MSHFTEFNKQASQYAQFRPNYPKELFQYLATITPAHNLAFDAGTGSGQCAVDLAHIFDHVVASDMSAEQISQATPRDNISYFVAPAHESNQPSQSVDLITVATAIHWFNFEAFYLEAKRILKPEGIIAAWAYGWHQCEDPEISKIFFHIGQQILMPFWSPQPKLIWDGYRSIPFPFQELKPPSFSMTVDWTLAELIGYISTWSASQKFLDEKGHHPVQSCFEDLLRLWGDPERKLRFQSPLHMRIGKVSQK